jgi:DNA-binding FadR family transcriptional regulator
VLDLGHRDVMRMLEQNMQHLVSLRGCTREEMEEARELLEVTAAWMAASRRTPVQVRRLYDCIPDIPPGELPTREQIDTNLRFHYEILEATGNRLLHMFAEPVSVVIYSFYRSDEHHADYYQQVLEEHRGIARAIENRDADRARKLMSAHICAFRGQDDGDVRTSLSGLRFD